MKFELDKDDWHLNGSCSKYKLIDPPSDLNSRVELGIRRLDKKFSEISIGVYYWEKEKIVKEFCKFLKIPFGELTETKLHNPFGNSTHLKQNFLLGISTLKWLPHMLKRIG